MYCSFANSFSLEWLLTPLILNQLLPLRLSPCTIVLNSSFNKLNLRIYILILIILNTLRNLKEDRENKQSTSL